MTKPKSMTPEQAQAWRDKEITRKRNKRLEAAGKNAGMKKDDIELFMGRVENYSNHAIVEGFLDAVKALDVAEDRVVDDPSVHKTRAVMDLRATVAGWYAMVAKRGLRLTMSEQECEVVSRAVKHGESLGVTFAAPVTKIIAARSVAFTPVPEPVATPRRKKASSAPQQDVPTLPVRKMQQQVLETVLARPKAASVPQGLLTAEEARGLEKSAKDIFNEKNKKLREEAADVRRQAAEFMPPPVPAPEPVMAPRRKKAVVVPQDSPAPESVTDRAARKANEAAAQGASEKARSRLLNLFDPDPDPAPAPEHAPQVVLTSIPGPNRTHVGEKRAARLSCGHTRVFWTRGGEWYNTERQFLSPVAKPGRKHGFLVCPTCGQESDPVRPDLLEKLYAMPLQPVKQQAAPSPPPPQAARPVQPPAGVVKPTRPAPREPSPTVDRDAPTRHVKFPPAPPVTYPTDLAGVMQSLVEEVQALRVELSRTRQEVDREDGFFEDPEEVQQLRAELEKLREEQLEFAKRNSALLSTCSNLNERLQNLKNKRK